MTIEERTSFQPVARTDAGIAILHRYETIASSVGGQRTVDLWCGAGEGTEVLRVAGAVVRGLDPDAAAVDAGRVAAPEAHLAVEDPSLAVCRLGPDDADVVLALQPERRPPAREDGVLDELVRLNGAGVAVVVAIAGGPSAGPTGGLRTARALAARLPGSRVLVQAAAEGSLIRSFDTGEDVVRARLPSGADEVPEDADALLVVAGLDPEDAAVLAVRPFPMAERARLEAALDELRAVNARLGREWLGRGDAAAAARTAGLEGRLREADQEIERLRAELRGLHARRGV